MKVMEEHNVEGGGTAGEDWKMKKTTKVVVVRRRRLVVIRLKLGLVFGLFGLLVYCLIRFIFYIFVNQFNYR